MTHYITYVSLECPVCREKHPDEWWKYRSSVRKDKPVCPHCKTSLKHEDKTRKKYDGFFREPMVKHRSEHEFKNMAEISEYQKERKPIKFYMNEST